MPYSLSFQRVLPIIECVAALNCKQWKETE